MVRPACREPHLADMDGVPFQQCQQASSLLVLRRDLIQDMEQMTRVLYTRRDAARIWLPSP